MQAVTDSAPPGPTRSGVLALSYEWIAYALLLTLALVLRVAELDTIPLTNPEATQALAAWRVLHPALPGSVIVPQSPLLFLLHGIGFSVFGGTEFAVRILTALAGTGLVIAPLLFRDWLGRERTLIVSLLLACSPVLLLASRFDTPTIWAVGAAVLALWALWRWWLTTQAAYALIASGFIAALVLLTDPAGWLFALVLVGAGGAALAWNRVDNPDDDPLPDIRERLRTWPWIPALLTAALTVLLVGTVFMAHLPGLSAIGQLLQTGVGGLLTPAAEAPPFWGFITALFYEPFVAGFALIAVWLLARQGTLSLAHRFLILWAVLATAALLIDRGARPEHALWLIAPLTVLASALVLACLQPDKHPFLEIPAWGKPALAVVMGGLLLMLAVNGQAMARAFLRTMDGSLLTVQSDAINLVWTLIALLFMIVGYLLASSLWGAAAALRGGALGIFAFALVTSLGSGWGAAVPHANDATEWWHVEAISNDARLLRQTLLDLTQRESGGFPFLEVSVQADDTGVVAWLLRDFVHVQYISAADEGRTRKVVLLPKMDELPDLGGSYVGQTFVIASTWEPSTLLGFDVLPWWLQRRVRIQPAPAQALVLWLRQDVYDGVKFDPNLQ